MFYVLGGVRFSERFLVSISYHLNFYNLSILYTHFLSELESVYLSRIFSFLSSRKSVFLSRNPKKFFNPRVFWTFSNISFFSSQSINEIKIDSNPPIWDRLQTIKMLQLSTIKPLKISIWICNQKTISAVFLHKKIGNFFEFNRHVKLSKLYEIMWQTCNYILKNIDDEAVSDTSEQHFE